MTSGSPDDSTRYAPSPSGRVRAQVALYDETGGSEGGTLEGRPVVILTTIGAQSGHIRKTPVIRIEQAGTYVAVASAAGARAIPPGTTTWSPTPMLESRTALLSTLCGRARCSATRKLDGGVSLRQAGRTSRSTGQRPAARFLSCCWSPSSELSRTPGPRRRRSTARGTPNSIDSPNRRTKERQDAQRDQASER
jgi:hypothetical protein